MKTTSLKLMAATTGLLLGAAAQAEDWTAQAIAPVTNPIFFETPLIQSEVRPIFAYHRLDNTFLGTDVDVRVYAVQLRYAVMSGWRSSPRRTASSSSIRRWDRRRTAGLTSGSA